jgi:hypothetical protein
LWLVDSEAIAPAQADRLDAIYAHRHPLSHELIMYIVDPGFEPSLELFTDALAILKAITVLVEHREGHRQLRGLR